MRAPFFVEVLHRNKEVRHRYRMDSLPIRIGRGYDNDIILDDPHTSAHHAVIDHSDDVGLLLQDLHSQNGTICKGLRQKEMLIDGNTIFRLGHTNLRVRSSNFPVDNEIEDSFFYNWEGWPPAVAGLALIIGLTLVDTWSGDSEKFELVRYLIAIVTALCLGMLWCGIWSFANRLFGRNARLGRHLFILGCGVVAMETWNLVSGAVAYAFSFEVFTSYGNHGGIAILAAMVFFHLQSIKPYRIRLFAAVSVILALLCSGILLMVNYHSNDRLAGELFMHERFPPSVRVSPDKPVSQFISNAATLKTQVDADRARLVKGDDGGGEDQD